MLDGLDPSELEARAVEVAVPRRAAGPDALGRALEMALAREHRRATGTFFTPAAVADHLTALALRGRAVADVRTVVDPSTGGGAFLLAAARWFSRRGVAAEDVVASRLRGVDVDPLAVLTSTSALLLWARLAGASPAPPHIEVADGLSLAPSSLGCGAGPDAVLGNPPFQSQLGTATARGAAAGRELRARLGSAVRPYTDTAALFLLVASRMVRPGGVVCLLLPQSVLGSSDASGVRLEIAGRGRLERVWADERSFADADVAVCAPVVHLGAPPRRRAIVLHRGTGPGAGSEPSTVTEVDVAGGAAWSAVLATRAAVPPVELDPGLPLGSRWRATAGFRDEYYGIAGLVREADEGEQRSAATRPVGRSGGPPPVAQLVTCGAVDPMRSLWGERPITIHRQRWDRPVVDVAALDPEGRVGRWARRILVPKLVVATQTRVLEAAPDPGGTAWPSVPAIAVPTHPRDLWSVAAVLHSPPVSAWLWQRRAGTARSRDALSVSAGDVESVPLPREGDAWQRGAAAAERAWRSAAAGDGAGWAEALGEVGRAMCAAYGVGDAVLEWWADRLPAFR